MNEWQWERVRNAGYRENRDKRRELQVFISDVLYTFDSVEKAERFLGQFKMTDVLERFALEATAALLLTGKRWHLVQQYSSNRQYLYKVESVLQEAAARLDMTRHDASASWPFSSVIVATQHGGPLRIGIF